MKTMFQRFTAGIISSAIMFNISGLIPVVAIESSCNNMYSYALFAGSFEEDAVNISSSTFNLNGSICTNGDVISNCNINNIFESVEKDIPDLNNKISDRFFNEGSDNYSEDYTWVDTNISVNTPIICDGEIRLEGNILLNKSIMSTDEITVEGNTSTNNDIVLYSKNGDINFTSNNTNITGLIYAPNGSVIFNSDNVNLNNTIVIAQKICFNSSTVNINTNNELIDFVNSKSESDGMNEDITPTIELFAACDYKNSSIDIEWESNVNAVYDILESEDNEIFNLVDEVYDRNSYSYAVNSFNKRKYIKIACNYGDGIVESNTIVIDPKDANVTVDVNNSLDIDDNSVATPFVLNSIGKDNNITIKSNYFECSGNISSANKIYISSNIRKEIGNKTENDNDFIYDSLNALFSDYNNTQSNKLEMTTDSYTIDEDGYFSNVNCCANDFKLNGNIYSDNQIMIDASSIISQQDDAQIIASKNGNITFNSDEFNYSGIIFAPNGYVEINSKEINFKGFIIASGILLDGENVIISESTDVFSSFYQLEQSYQQDTDKLIEDYYEKVEELKDDPENLNIINEYQYLRDSLEEKNILLSEQEISELFDKQTQPILTKNVIKKAKSDFHPCDGIDKMYDVLRTSSTYSHNGKAYQYYSLSVSDKVSTKNPKLRRNYSPGIYLIGECTNPTRAKKLLNTAMKNLFGTGVSALLSCAGHPVAGKTLSVAIKTLFNYTPSPHDLYTTSANFLRLSDVCLNTTMKYTWVKYKGKWEFGYSCDRTSWKYSLTLGKLNKKTKLYDYTTRSYSFTNNGNYFKPYVAIKTVVDFKKMFGDDASSGNYDPIGYNKTTSYSIKDSDGKLKKTFSPLFIKNTIGLM